MLRNSFILALTVAFGAVCGAQSAGAQGVFTLSSSSFKDGERLATKMAGNNKSNPNCVGENISPRCPGAIRPRAPRALRS